ncbi:Plasmid recombination enzyme [Succiniclasticum ruminis]|uniref:Plasmid recombination enzyme n=1 Tax=Succiniclasticum ruminis TaxID=40841 RepID=A0A1G6P9H6_9FIRM|nr:plasmid recombination protein [Succiniclasticum ruminis]SDC76641.1 Plasmid recombination enzyme [Succiniclasticum ruminis]
MADNYAIIGVAKLHTAGNVAGVLAHALRTRPTANSNGAGIDVRIQPPPLEKIMERVAEYMPRKNAVIMYDFLTTASPAFFKSASPEQVEAWKRDSLKWVQDIFGKDNVVSAIFHDKDEQTCHGSYLIIPEYEGKLNARHFTGGREKLRGLWTSYAQAMSKYGLKRGKLYSPAEHKTIKQYYADINAAAERAARAAIRPEQLPEPGIKDHASPREYAAPLINYAIKTMQQRNANLATALAAERKENEKLIAATAKDRELYSFLQANPDAFRKLEEKLERERESRAADKEKYLNLIAAVKTFFRKNIPANSKDRTPERLGALLGFPELKKAIQIDLTRAARPQQGTERTL